MSQATATKFWRLLEPVGKYLFKREKPIEPKSRHTEYCKYCHTPMSVADGQIAYFHSKCRGRARASKRFTHRHA